MDDYGLDGVDVMELDDERTDQLAGRARWLVDARWRSSEGYFDPDARPRTWRRSRRFQD